MIRRAKVEASGTFKDCIKDDVVIGHLLSHALRDQDLCWQTFSTEQNYLGWLLFHDGNSFGATDYY